MNVLTPVSKIMTDKVYTVAPEEPLEVVKELFDTHRFHHIPVVRERKVVGIISKSDFVAFCSGLSKNYEARFITETLMRAHHAEEIMTAKTAKISPDDRIAVAVEIFKENLFHALPVVDDAGELVGIVTTHDIIVALSKEKVADLDYKNI